MSATPFGKLQSIEKKEDERGWLSELIKDPKFGQIFVVKVYPGKTRGGHYHTRKVERFFIVDGTVEFTLVNVETKEEQKIVLGEGNIQEIEIHPKWVHKVDNRSDKTATLVIHTNEIFNKDDPDTFSWEFT